MADVSGPASTKTITTNTDTYICTIGDSGEVTLHINGTFDSATATVGYLNRADGTVKAYNSSEATDVSAFEVLVEGGQGTKVYVTTSGGGGSMDIDVEFH